VLQLSSGYGEGVVAWRELMASLASEPPAEIPMPYSLHRLAAGSYDLILDGKVVGSVVRDQTRSGQVRAWHAELMSEAPPLPAPFTRETYRFDTLEAVITWLGGVTVQDDG
jgi:hypothetical protein